MKAQQVNVLSEKKLRSIVVEVLEVILSKNIENLEPDNFDEKFIFVDNPTIEVNSTEIRDRVRKNMSIDFLVRPKTKEYIVKKKLYTGDR